MIDKLKSLWRQVIRESDRALLPADSRQVRPLTIVVSIMCALGCLAGLGASAGFRAANTWTSDLKSAMSVVVQSPRTDEDLARAAVIVGRVPGVTRSEAMSRDRAKELLRNYGTDMGATLDALPVPRLIEVGVTAGQTNVKTDIEKALKAAGFTLVVDDHSRFTGEVLRTSTVVRIVAILALVALVVAAIATIAFAARAALETRREAVNILHLVGAKDSFVAREVQIRFLRLGFVAGLLGANAAGVIALIGTTVFAFGASDFTSGAPLLNWTDLWILLVAPLVTACASAVAADLAARATLRDLV
ncbi:MAG: cell division protein FtsX [Hyphomonadaceae bacterium]|jgi:cell division transport system permease protein